MPYDEKPVISPEPAHNLVMENRKKLTVSGVSEVESFNEEEVIMASSGWTLSVKGEGLHMEKLSVDSGDVIITGRIDSVEYEEAPAARTGFFKRLFS